MSDLVARLRMGIHGLQTTDLLEEAADRIEQLERLDREAAEYVECVICMRTHFTGDPPYVGWKGLGLALTETLDHYDQCKKRVERLEAGLRRIINAECRYGTIAYHMRETADQALGEWEEKS